ncbi:MAG: MFS transporter [Ruminococcus sp.]|nr:MFS transporter [Ruminococcus sp.]
MKVTAKCSLLMAAYYSMTCVLLSYIAYYLGSVGISDLSISILIGLSCAAGGVLQIAAGRIADRDPRWNWKRIMLLIGTGEIILAVSRLLISYQGWQCFAYGLMIVFQLIMMPMVNLASFYYPAKGIPVNFGVARGIGSAAFALVSFLTGKLTEMSGSGSLLIITVVLSALFLAAVWIMPYDENNERSADKVQSTDHAPKTKLTYFVRKYSVFTSVTVGITLLFVYHNMVNSFFIRLVEAAGGNSKSLGIALAVAAIAELPVLFLYSRISGERSNASVWLLVIAGSFFVIRGVLYIAAASVTMIYFIQLLQSVSYGLAIAAKATYADESMAAEDKATGQALMTFTDAFGCVAGSVIGGVLLDIGGIGLVLKIGLLIAFIGTIIMLITAIKGQGRR